MDTQSPLQSLIENPAESLAVELKQWIDPGSPEGREKIAKGCLALYNNNGGSMVIGICDDGTPDSDNVPDDIRAMFHVDVVQAIVSKYSYTPFEIRVEFVERDNQEYPIIQVPGGVTTPAVCKSHLGTLYPDEVYVRSLTANNTVSSSKPKRRDWDRLLRYCLDNREADIGGFFRRHLGVTVDLDQLRSSFTLPKSVDKRAFELLNKGNKRFRDVNPEGTLPDFGFVEIGIVIEGKATERFRADQSFLQRLETHRVRLSGWPPFVCIRNSEDNARSAYVYDGAWEANMVFLNMPRPGPSNSIDFWRMSPNGEFYTKRALQDDMGGPGDQLAPRQFLDPLLQLRRITEVISIGLEFTRALEFDSKTSQIAFAWRWTGLQGRALVPWAHPDRPLSTNEVCVDNEAVETVLVPADAPNSSIWQYVEKVGAGLMCHFGGYDAIGSTVVEAIVGETLGERF